MATGTGSEGGCGVEASAVAGTTCSASPWTIIETSDVQKVKRPDGSKVINGFRVGECLGEGSFGKVKLAEEETSAERFAMKVFSKSRLRRQREFLSGGPGGGMRVRTALDKVYAEVGIMKQLVHPSCIRLYAVFDEPDNEGKLYLVLEYAAGGATMEWDSDRRSFFRPGIGGVFDEPSARSSIRDALAGLSYLHSCRIAHRDVKPQNLLVDSRGRTRLADFGVAVVLDEAYLIRGTEGTYYFYAPEMCRTGYTAHDGRRADIWATGVTLWAFLFGSVPFFHQDLVRLLDQIAEASYEVPSEPACSDACRRFLRRLLTAEPAARPLCPELLQDSWCSQPGVASDGNSRCTPPLLAHPGDG